MSSFCADARLFGQEPNKDAGTKNIGSDYIAPPTPLSFTRLENEVTVTFDPKEFRKFAEANPEAEFYVEQEDGSLYDRPISVPLYWENQPDSPQTSNLPSPSEDALESK